MSATIATTLFANYFSKSSIRHLKEGDYFKEFSDETNPMNKKYTSGWGVENKFKKLETGISEIEGQWKNEEEIKEKIKEYKENYLISEEDKEYLQKRYDAFKNLKEDAAKIVTISEKIYDNYIFYLEAIIRKCPQVKQRSEYHLHTIHFEMKIPRIDSIIYTYASETIKCIIEDEKNFPEAKKNGSILVFLPGYAEIQAMFENLHSALMQNEVMKKKFDKNEIVIIQLHSNLSE